MSQPSPPSPAKLVVGIILRDRGLLTPVCDRLVQEFGDIDMVSSWFSFAYTRYYETEMGTGLCRRMTAFKQLIDQDDLARIKHITNALEIAFSKNGGRRVNIDPGYLLRERFVLATGKNFTHRIYVGRQIYADLTLIYQKGRFATLPWTYPDYAADNMQAFLYRVRRKYIIDLKTTTCATA